MRAALEARARALRRDGASMAEIERETGVPAPTLHQWAARGKWRLCDLEEELDKDRLSASPSPAGEGLGWGVQRAPHTNPFAGRASADQHPTLALPSRGGKGESGSGVQALDDPQSFLSSPTSVGSVLAPGEQGSPSLRAGGRPCDASGVGETGSEPPGVSGQNTPDPQGPQGEQPPAASRACPGAARTRPTGGEGAQQRLVPSPENLLALAQTAKAEAMRLYRLGRVKPAREHLLTAQRFVAAAGGGGEAQAEPSDGEAARAELERRLLRLYPSELAKYLRAIEAGEVAGYLAERETGAERWREPFWWPDLIQARLQYPPHGFREAAPEGEDCEDDAGELPFLNACLTLLCTRPGWRVMLEGN